MYWVSKTAEIKCTVKNVPPVNKSYGTISVLMTLKK